MIGSFSTHLRLLVVLAFGLTILKSEELPQASPEKVGLSSKKLKKVDQVIQNYIDKKQLAGAVTIIARKGKVIHFSAHGMRDLSKVRPMEEDSIFRIYSMTKAVVSVAAMVLVEQENSA